MKDKRKWLFLVLTVCLIGLGWKYLNPAKIYDDSADSKFTSIQLFDNQKYVLLTTKDENTIISFYGQNYVVTVKQHTLYVGNENESPKIGEEEYFKITTYNLNTPNLEKKEFDLYQLLGKNNTYRNYKNTIARFYYQGQDYLIMRTTRLKNGVKEKKSFLFTAEGQWIKEGADQKIEIIEKTRPYRNKINWGRGNIDNQIQKELSKYNLYLSINEIISTETSAEGKIDISGTNFARLYPDLTKNMKNLSYIYMRPEQYDEKEWFDNLIHWFAPQGQEVMELYAEDEETGERTQIKSYDDYVSWVQAHPREEKDDD